jgi:hypothetical protein
MPRRAPRLFRRLITEELGLDDGVTVLRQLGLISET